MRHQDYFSNKDILRMHATGWSNYMSLAYSSEIRHSVENATAYHEGYEYRTDNKGTGISFELQITDSVSSIFNEAIKEAGKICVLNFASYKEPGGLYLKGSCAQEESLCHESTLYNVLSDRAFKPYYDSNNTAKNRGLYLDRALYTPDILFLRNGIIVKADVISCAAPNFASARKYCNVTEEENVDVLRKRISFVLDIMALNNVDIPILGAYGAGVFGQDAVKVAEIFRDTLSSKAYPFKKVVFAVIAGPNADAFKNVLFPYCIA